MARKKIANLICVLIAVLIFVGSSDAFTDLYFGTGERIKCIQALNKVKSDEPDNGSFFKPVKLDPITGTPYVPPDQLCYKYSIKYFILGVSVHDDGYVLSNGDDYYTYVQLDQSKIQELQKNGTLPDPLPAYSFTWKQYAAGYSLWIFIALILFAWLAWIGLKAAFNKLRRIKNRGTYCLNCHSALTIKDFSDGRCEACSEPVPAV
jgi:hypothetical protein